MQISIDRTTQRLCQPCLCPCKQCIIVQLVRNVVVAWNYLPKQNDAGLGYVPATDMHYAHCILMFEGLHGPPFMSRAARYLGTLAVN
jgi:hypothetical protein